MSVLLLNVAFKMLFYLCVFAVLLCQNLLSHFLSPCWSLFIPYLSVSNSGYFFRCSGRNMDYWPVHFWILTDSYLIFYHFILTHLPASHVAGAIDPVWLSQRNHWSSAMQPLPLCFAYRIHKQTHKDVIEVRESSQSELTHWHGRTHTHKHMWVLRLVTSEILQMCF